MPGLADGTLRAFFDQAALEFDEAGERLSIVEHELRVANVSVRLRFAGAGLPERLLPALAARLTGLHRECAATIHLWTGDSVARSRPAPWRNSDVRARGFVCEEHDEGVLAVHDVDFGALTLIDRDSRQVLYRVTDLASIPWWEPAGPLRPALFWALGGSQRHLVHAGAVGDGARGGVLLAGSGGSGKTTVALASLDAGLEYVADDYLLLETAGPPRAWNLYGTAKLESGHLERFPRFAAALDGRKAEGDEKVVLDVAAHAPRSLAESLPVRAVLAPRIRGGQSAVRPISGAEALIALAPSTVLQMPFDGGLVVGALAKMVRGLACFALDVGDAPGDLAAAVDRVLDETAAQAVEETS